jgi:hypothetical protein
MFLTTSHLIETAKCVGTGLSSYSNHVLVTPTHICGTDGVCLCKIMAESNIENDILIPVNTIKAWVKMVPKRYQDIALNIKHIANKTYSLELGSTVLPFNSGEEKYPAVDKVIPENFEDSNTHNRNYNWTLVAKLANIFTNITSDEYPKPEFSVDVGVLAFRSDDIILILMPLNT